MTTTPQPQNSGMVFKFRNPVILGTIPDRVLREAKTVAKKHGIIGRCHSCGWWIDIVGVAVVSAALEMDFIKYLEYIILHELMHDAGEMHGDSAEGRRWAMHLAEKLEDEDFYAHFMWSKYAIQMDDAARRDANAVTCVHCRGN